jgi:hypothetical protein
MHNRYFIIDTNDPNLLEIERIIVGRLSEQRLSIDKQLMVIKLPEGDHNEYAILAQYQEYNHEEILNALNNDRWRLL